VSRPRLDALAVLDRQGEPFEIRELTSDDWPALLTFYEAFEPKRAAQGLPPEGSERIRKWLTPLLGSGIHLAVTKEGELVGHALVVPTNRDGIGEYAVFLRRDLRGRGIGTQMNHAIVEAARNAGFAGLWLTVTPRNRAAIRSYEKVGFRFVPATVLSMEAEMELNLTDPYPG
jgi:RimJ/RimL family protein N-acetyltransferase